MMPSPQSTLPIKLHPSNLRPLAYRILSKKHGLNIKSDALALLAEHIGPKFGTEWKGTRAQAYLEDVARLWKEQERGMFLDGEGLGEVIKELEALETKIGRMESIQQQSAVANGEVRMDTFINNMEVDERAVVAKRTDTVVDEMSADDREAAMIATPATSISPPPMTTTMNWREHFQLINAHEQPLFDYDPRTKQYVRSQITNSKLSGSTLESNVKLFTNRHDIIRDRLLRNEKFQNNTFDATASFAAQNSITSIKNLLGRNNQRFLLFGMLTFLNGEWWIQDTSDKIQLDLNQTEPNPGSFYTAGSFVLSDGIYSAGLFYCSSISPPPGERRMETLEANGNIDFLGIHANMRIDKELSRRLRVLEMELEHKIVILGGNCHLDDLRTFDALKKLFLKLSEEEHAIPISIVLNGPFVSAPKHASEYKQCFNSLAALLEEFPVIAGNIALILVPGQNDSWSGGVWPQQSIPKVFGSRLARVTRNVQWASNPSRLVYLSQEIVLVRDDLGARFARNTISFPKQEEMRDKEREIEIDKLDALPARVSEARKVVKTVLDQGHIAPFTKSLKPVAWHLDHIMTLSPIPNVLILCDPTSPQFDVTYNGCRCLNPGPLIQKRQLNYMEYNLATKRAEIKGLYV